jgi:hypothetical protein
MASSRSFLVISLSGRIRRGPEISRSGGYKGIRSVSPHLLRCRTVIGWMLRRETPNSEGHLQWWTAQTIDESVFIWKGRDSLHLLSRILRILFDKRFITTIGYSIDQYQPFLRKYGFRQIRPSWIANLGPSFQDLGDERWICEDYEVFNHPRHFNKIGSTSEQNPTLEHVTVAMNPSHPWTRLRPWQ